MILPFVKYHGTGNDFIIIDNRLNTFTPSSMNISFLCNRNMGIGADGVILFENKASFDFSMRYYNSNGFEGSMCGNGGRCISAFYYNNVAKLYKLRFNAVDGIHQSEILNIESKNSLIVKLQMQDVSQVDIFLKDFYLNTGSPHVVQFVKDVDKVDVVKEGRRIRYSDQYAPEGVNVNFVEIQNKSLYVRTYERGVEDETLSCGTGVTASAIAASFVDNVSSFDITTRGGNLKVSFQKKENKITNIWLEGPATFVYSGEIEI
ncbi:MAG: diaminopimelate epimerase [Bacteroidota bacterium]